MVEEARTRTGTAAGIRPGDLVPFGEAVRAWAKIAALSFGGPAGQIAPALAQGAAQHPHGVLDQGDAQVFHGREVPVEGGRHDPRAAGDLAQRDAAERTLVH